MKRFLCSLAFLVICAVSGLPSLANAQVGIHINLGAPPPPSYVVPPARPGYIWAPGYWNLVGGRRVWVNGFWVPARPGYAYTPARWVHGPHGWHFQKPGWSHHRPPPHHRPPQHHKPPHKPPHHKPPQRPPAGGGGPGGGPRH